MMSQLNTQQLNPATVNLNSLVYIQDAVQPFFSIHCDDQSNMFITIRMLLTLASVTISGVTPWLWDPPALLTISYAAGKHPGASSTAPPTPCHQNHHMIQKTYNKDTVITLVELRTKPRAWLLEISERKNWKRPTSNQQWCKLEIYQWRVVVYTTSSPHPAKGEWH